MRDLTGNETKAKAVLISDSDQTVAIETPDGIIKSVQLRAGTAKEQEL